MTGLAGYPWFAEIQGDVLEQGDLLMDCPIFVAPDDLDIDALEREHGDEPLQRVAFEFRRFDVIVMSQSCDLANNKLREVLLCPLFKHADYEEGPLSLLRDWENARMGRFPAYHVINACELPGHESEARIVDFKRVFSLPVGFLRNFAGRRGSRVRLMPPYREHLSQSFARYFMRVGLPVDIAPFR